MADHVKTIQYGVQDGAKTIAKAYISPCKDKECLIASLIIFTRSSAGDLESYKLVHDFFNFKITDKDIIQSLLTEADIHLNNFELKELTEPSKE